MTITTTTKHRSFKGMMAATLALPLLLSAPVHAGQDRQPEPEQRHVVTNVASGDVLNIRTQPDAAADILTTLPADAKGIIVAGTRRESGGQIWWQVVTPQGTGWANASYLAPAGDDTARDTSFPLHCAGTEPFWGVSLADGKASFTTPDSSQAFTAGPMEWASGSIRHFIVRLKMGEASGLLTGLRASPACSDGMSDTAFPYEGVLVKPDGTVLSGCCRRAG